MTGTISELRQEILKVEWTVDDFLSLQPECLGSSHTSPKFRLSDVWWSLQVCPYGEEKYEDDIGLYLHLDSSSSSTVLFTLAIKKTDGSLLTITPYTWRFQNDGYGCANLLSKSVLMQKKDEFLLENALTFCCILQKAPSLEAMDALCLDLKKLLVSSAQSDVTVKLKSKEYKAHRAVLAARSDVFASALKHDTSEKETGIIRIEDCDADSFQEFLQHLYTGRAEINEDNVFHLYRTADKYLVGELKSHCVAFLMENLSVENFCDVVALADNCGRNDLKNFCKEFFDDNAGSILVTSDWATLMRSHCDAATELLKHVAPKFLTKK